jgi:hypothetical protein
MPLAAFRYIFHEDASATLDAGSQQPERDRAIVLLLLDTGLRLSEAAVFESATSTFIEGRCRVLGKGGRERVVYQSAARRVVPSDIASLVAASSCPTTSCSSDEVVGIDHNRLWFEAVLAGEEGFEPSIS